MILIALSLPRRPYRAALIATLLLPLSRRPNYRPKADIIKVNKCLKSWFGCPQAKAFTKGVDPNINKQYKEEAATKAATKLATKEKARAEGDAVVNT
jgi:hypothetical protein